MHSAGKPKSRLRGPERRAPTAQTNTVQEARSPFIHTLVEIHSRCPLGYTAQACIRHRA